MEAKRQGGKSDHVVIVTSEAEGAKVKKIRIKRWTVVLTVIVFCVLVGVVLGYFFNEARIRMKANEKIDEYKSEVENLTLILQEEQAAKEVLKQEYEDKIAGLNDKLTIMSETINMDVAEIQKLTEELERYARPTLLPLTGSATIEVLSEDEPKCIFYATDGALIVSAANGVVTELVEDSELGYRVVVEHKDGYRTIYYNVGDPKVKVGDEVHQGTTLFVVETINAKLVYQIEINGSFVNPMDIMQISG